jgi:Uma2 family endonuclease
LRVTQILDIPEVRQRISPLSVEEYHLLGEFNDNGRRTELIRGIVIEKISKSPLQVFLAERIRELLQRHVSTDFLAESPLTLADSEPEPDVAVIRGHAKDFRTQHPRTAELVVEIAISSAVLDRESAALYAEAGVKEYWIVLASTQRIEIYQNPSAGRYLTNKPSPEVKLSRVPPSAECRFPWRIFSTNESSQRPLPHPFKLIPGAALLAHSPLPSCP